VINEVIPFAVALAAVAKGDWRARAMAACIVTTEIVEHYGCDNAWCWGPPIPAVVVWRWMTEDLALVAICLACAWRARRYWVLVASSFAILILATDVMLSFLHGVSGWAAGSANIVWNYALSATILWGVWSPRPARE
jgi:hypothetical protein